MGRENTLVSHEEALQPIKDYANWLQKMEVTRRELLKLGIAGVSFMNALAAGIAILEAKPEIPVRNLEEDIATFLTSLEKQGESVLTTVGSLLINTTRGTSFPAYDEILPVTPQNIATYVKVENPLLFRHSVPSQPTSEQYTAYFHLVYFKPETGALQYVPYLKFGYSGRTDYDQQLAKNNIEEVRINTYAKPDKVNGLRAPLLTVHRKKGNEMIVAGNARVANPK